MATLNPLSVGSKKADAANAVNAQTPQFSKEDSSALTATTEHLKQHRYKWLSLGAIALALGLGLGIGLAAHYYSLTGSASGTQQQNIQASQAGTTVPQSSVVPPKGDSSSTSSRRRLSEAIAPKGSKNPFRVDAIRAALKESSTATPVADLDALSDYNLQPEPNYVVRDPSATTIETLNIISCYLDQLRVSDVGLNLENIDVNASAPNPDGKPYIAMVDPKLCGNEGSMLPFAVEEVSGPSEGGPGIYSFTFSSVMGTSTVNGHVINTIGGCDEDGCPLLQSTLSYFMPEDAYFPATKAALLIDLTNPSQNNIQFADGYDFAYLCGGELSNDFEFDDWDTGSYYWTGFDDDQAWNDLPSYYSSWDDDFLDVDDDWWNGDDFMNFYYMDNSYDQWYDENDPWWYSSSVHENSVEKRLKNRSPVALQRERKSTYNPKGGRRDASNPSQSSNKKENSKTLHEAEHKLKHTLLAGKRALASLSSFKSSEDVYTVDPTAPLNRGVSIHRATAPSNRLKNSPKAMTMRDIHGHANSKRAAAKEERKQRVEKLKEHMRKSTNMLKKLHQKKNKSKMSPNLRRVERNLQSESYDSPEYYFEYLNTRYNPTTFDGSALTQAYGSATYRLVYSENAFIRSKDGKKPSCVDYSTSNRILVPTGYKLYNADDGSAVVLEMGYLIEKTVDGVLQEAYVDTWGVYAFYMYDENTGEWSYDDSWLQDGATVEKVDYGTGDLQSCTLNIVNAKLTKIETTRLTLNELKNTPLIVRNYAADYGQTYKIAWNGQKLVRTSEYVTQCVMYDYDTWIEGTDGEWYAGYTPITVETDEKLTSDDCYCLDYDSTDNTATVRTSGSYDYTYSSLYPSTEVRLSSAEQKTFTPSQELFPYLAYEGLLVQSEGGSMSSIYGQIDLNYEHVQTLYGVNSRKYEINQRLHQKSSGATGKVVVNSPLSITGYTCKNWECLEFSYPNWGSCDPDSTYKSSYLMKGLVLTQGDVVGFVDADYVYAEYGIPVIMKNSSQSFNITKDIQVSYPKKATGHLTYYSNITGTLTAPENVAVSTNWNDFVIDGVANCTSSIFQDWSNPLTYVPLETVVAGANGVTLYLSGSINEDWQWGYVVQAGSDCDSTILEVTVNVPDAYQCDTVPNVTIYCVGVADRSDFVTVQLPFDNPVKFSYGYDEDDKILLKVDDDSTIDIGYTYWAEDILGDVYEITGDTYVTFRTETTVYPGATVDPLLCYDNCPDASEMNYCSDDSCVRDRPTRLDTYVKEDEKAAGCTGPFTVTEYPTWTFSNIGGNPSMNVTWTKGDEQTDGIYAYTPTILMGDVGMNCSVEDSQPTVVYNEASSDITCTTYPKVTIKCLEGNDVIDFRQAYSYSFNSNTGIMTDNEADENALFTDNSNYGEYSSQMFGPFFPNNSEKKKLACPDDPNFVCMRTAESVLDTIYYYSAGPGAQRASLIDIESGQNVPFAFPKTLIYTHEGDSSNSGNDYAGSTSLLSYYGPRQLYGLPQFCLNAQTGQASSKCIPPGSTTGSTTNGDDISISDDTVITDLYGYKYYAKASTINEIYPVASDASICDGLSMNDFDLEPPNLVELFIPPPNMCDGFPSISYMEENYLQGGIPQVFGGQTTNELAADQI